VNSREYGQTENVLFDVDVKGGISLKNKFGTRAIAIFVMPPSVKELENRLIKRGTDTAEKIRIRIEKANEEMSLADQFDKVIVNHQLDRAKAEATKTVLSFLSR
jgi:guanylate kinase